MTTMTPARSAEETGAILERVVLQGDLAALSPADRVNYYKAVCESVGLNPLTQPFEYMKLNGKLRLYPTRNASDQLRKLHGISIYEIHREVDPDTKVYTVTAYGRDKTGRQDSSTGSVDLGTLRGEALANAYMKAETKAKRRLTMSMVGLGWLDETEVQSIQAPTVSVDPATGEIIGEKPAQIGFDPYTGNLDSTGDPEPLVGDALERAKAAVENEALQRDIFWPKVREIIAARFEITDENLLSRDQWVELYRAFKDGEFDPKDEKETTKEG
jgi:hypothetical protein